MVQCLKTPGPKRPPYFEFHRERIDSRGSLISPVSDGKVVHYRCPGLHNLKSFDLWGEDAQGRPDGINHWEK